MKLYYSRGACSIGPHIVAEELGLSFDLERISLKDMDHHSPEFREINPRSRVPTLVTDHGVITETLAILIYLAERKPEAELFPTQDAQARAKCMEWLSWIASVQHANLILHWRAERYVQDAQAILDLRNTGFDLFESGCGEIENRIVGDYALDYGFSVVDAYLMFCFRQGNRIGISMSARFPRFSEWADRMMARPSVARVFEREEITLLGKPW